MSMVNSGIPIRESTKRDVPSLMPLPTVDAKDGGFDWHQRKRRTRPRRRQHQPQQQQQQQGRGVGEARLSSPLFVTVTAEMEEAVVHERMEKRPPGARGPARAEEDAELNGAEEQYPARQQHLAGLEFPKGVVNGEGCTAAAVAASAGGVGRGRGQQTSGMGWLLASDMLVERRASGDGLSALERKRRRMREFSRKRGEQQAKLERLLREEEGGRGSVDRRRVNHGSDGVNGGVAAAAAGAPQTDLRAGGECRRGRDEALTLRMMRSRRRHGTPGLLSWNFTFAAAGGGGVRGAFGRSGRRGSGSGSGDAASIGVDGDVVPQKVKR